VRESLGEAASNIAFHRQAMARLLYIGGDRTGAEAELRLNLEQAHTPPQAESLAWLLIDTGRPDEAETPVKAHRSQADPRRAAALRAVGAWAKIAQDRKDEAREELAALVDAAQPPLAWDRVDLLLELMRISSDRIERSRWTDQVNEAIARARACNQLENQPWADLRNTERLASLAVRSLGDEPCGW